MAVTAKHKKARIFRDFLINNESVNMFKEEEVERAILFRSVYPVKEDDKKQFMLIVDDTVYITMQALILKDIPEEKRDAILRLANKIHIEYPTVKYVLTEDGQLMTSMVFHAHESNMDPGLILTCIIEFFKVVSTNHNDRFLDVLNA